MKLTRPTLLFIFFISSLSLFSCENFEPSPLPPYEDLFLKAPIVQSIRTGNSFVELTWTFEDTLNLKEFRLYRKQIEDSLFMLIDATNKLFYRDDSLISGGQYIYQIAGLSQMNIEGERTPPIWVKLPPLATPVTLYEPTTVSGSITSLRLRWTPNTDDIFASYQIMRSENFLVSLSSTSVQEITDQQTSSYIDTGLWPGTTYYYRVYVFDRNGMPVGSNIVNGTTPENFPPQPVVLSQPVQDSVAFRLTWTLSTENDFANYRLYRSTSSPVDTVSPPLTIINNPAITEFRDASLQTNTTYFYRIFVYDRFGLSAGSNEVSAIINR